MTSTVRLQVIATLMDRRVNFYAKDLLLRKPQHFPGIKRMRNQYTYLRTKGTDPDLLNFVPKPRAAVCLLFPSSPAIKE